MKYNAAAELDTLDMLGRIFGIYYEINDWSWIKLNPDSI